MKNVLSIAKFLSAALILSQFAACAAPGAVQPGEVYSTRELTPEEKRALAPIVADTLKDPESARFKWMPVVLREREGITDYCGLVNAKNSYGGYNGYMRFYGQLVKDTKGHFTSMYLKLMQGPSDEPTPFDTRWMNGLCENYGYVDFSAAR